MFIKIDTKIIIVYIFSMSYKITKITILRDNKSFYLRHIFHMNEDFDLPYIAGDYREIIPKEKVESGIVEKINQPLFNSAGLLRIAEEAEENSIIFLELEKGHWLKTIIIDFENIVVDLFYSEGNRLLYSFFNVSIQTPTTLIIQKEDDQGLTFQKIKSNAVDPLFRQFFIKKALNQVKDEDFKKLVTPELMTAAEVANYLQMQIKTIQNWTSSGKIPVEYAGGTPRYRKATIDMWLKGKKI